MSEHTHIPRSHPRIWLPLLLGFALVAGILGYRIASLIHNPPAPPQTSYMGRDSGNPWGPPK